MSDHYQSDRALPAQRRRSGPAWQRSVPTAPPGTFARRTEPPIMATRPPGRIPSEAAQIGAALGERAVPVTARDRLGRPRVCPIAQVSRLAARRTRSALRVILSLGPERPQSTTSGVMLLVGGFYQYPPGCQRPSGRRRRSSSSSASPVRGSTALPIRDKTSRACRMSYCQYGG